jgi:hypothetical protein
VVSFKPRPLYPRGKSPGYPLDRRLGGPHNRSERRGEEKILAPTGTRTPTSPKPVAIPTPQLLTELPHQISLLSVLYVILLQSSIILARRIPSLHSFLGLSVIPFHGDGHISSLIRKCPNHFNVFLYTLSVIVSSAPIYLIFLLFHIRFIPDYTFQIICLHSK